MEPDHRSEDSEEREILEDEKDGSSGEEGAKDELAKIVFDGEEQVEELKQAESGGHSSHKHQTRRNSEDALRILEDSIINDTFNQRNQEAGQVIQTEPSADDVSEEQQKRYMELNLEDMIEGNQFKTFSFGKSEHR